MWMIRAGLRLGPGMKLVNDVLDTHGEVWVAGLGNVWIMVVGVWAVVSLHGIITGVWLYTWPETQLSWVSFITLEFDCIQSILITLRGWRQWPRDLHNE